MKNERNIDCKFNVSSGERDEKRSLQFFVALMILRSVKDKKKILLVRVSKIMKYFHSNAEESQRVYFR